MFDNPALRLHEELHDVSYTDQFYGYWLSIAKRDLALERAVPVRQYHSKKHRGSNQSNALLVADILY